MANLPCSSRMTFISGDTYKKLEAVAQEWGLSVRETLERVLKNHKRGRVGSLKRPPKTYRAVSLTFQAKEDLKRLRCYYGGTTDDVVRYAVENTAI